MGQAKEPWDYGEDNDGWYVSKGDTQLAHGLTESNARRIVACVNACEGIRTENLEENRPVKWLASQHSKLVKQRADFADDVAFLAGMLPCQEMAHAASRLHKKIREEISKQ